MLWPAASKTGHGPGDLPERRHFGKAAGLVGVGKPVATAIGVAVYDWCAFEDCHTGIYNTAPIVIIASKIVTCPKRAHAYSRLQYVFVGRSPFSSLPAHMNFSNIMFGSHASPAANQTVLLGC